MQVSLQALRAFESAARRGSFKLAAEELALTPTAISHHISNLENRLNVDLFHRRVRGVTLTDKGKQLALATSDGFSIIEKALTELEQTSSVIKVNTTSSLAAMALIPTLPHFSKTNPNIKVEISTSETLDSQSYILPIRLGAAKEVSVEDIIKHESFNLFAAKSSNIDNWSKVPITLFTTQWKNNSLPEAPLSAWLRKNEVDKADITIKTFDQELFGIQQAIAENGFVFCSTTLVKSLLKDEQLQELDTQAVVSELVYYIPNKMRLSTRHTNAFITWLTEQLS